MAVIHQTTLRPTKGELLTAWLPTRPWYRGTADGPRLEAAGGFRLDDPDGAVGIEFILVTDVAGAEPVTYLVPLSYRGAPLDGADHALVGTMEHGVLGRRWVYDGCHDPVVVAQLLALIEGRAQAQDQNVSDAPDPTVVRAFTGDPATPARPAGTAVDGADHTEVPTSPGTALRLIRVVRPGTEAPAALGHVSGPWRRPDGDRVQGVLAYLSA
ncbi:maltokinase N-terminal cap-like domain-containing protein [Streptantibioticus cattleyicolor]|uniref:Maltokinase N-terminal cap domain-containing protein n=1 Tax=Streptantibioticus cattleyicolor (strain ATCC 35852 / DSM 46488 / JCM 4925 / NBRC 14057 / NRRL 8057) TaxID=1003195 RepID=F8JM60_STREN|nr:hypothetical protein [Streptantibioticus cattleyicolor]AEW99416.1 hypothetical protein SCATT_p12230 [Streptantibioticus cattleyicolor NRRL 8057 = DSM 46488]CCB71544.1 conserved protein of unknown function [Streptantibioticus cattleyicolor NRRL 8057 = DSM 46488]